MIYLILGLVLFLGAHFAILFRGLRTAVLARLGRNIWRSIIGLCAFAGLILIAYGFSQYRTHGYITIYTPPLVFRHLALILNLPIFVLVISAYLPGNIRGKLKHPMLVAIKLWATAHLFANGDLGGIILFGSILAWAVIARIAVKKREVLEGAQAEILAPHAFRNDLIAILLGLLLYLLVFKWLHMMLIGVQPL
jgi:uncharacterized membrane protein